jgi:hypothetical protein
MDYLLLKLLHLLCFVYWLGADIGVFYASRHVCDPTLGVEARATAAKIMGWVDMLPRYCLVLILPLGITLAVRGGWWAGGAPAAALSWVLAALWLGLVVALGRRPPPARLAVLRRIDYALRFGVIAATAGIGLAGLAGAGPLTATWLAGKSLLFAALVASGLAVRVLAAPFGPAFAQVMQAGSQPGLESILQQAMARAKRVVVLIWVLLVAAAWLGVAKPA